MDFKHGLLGIGNDVEEYLLQLGTISHDLWQVRGKMGIDLNIIRLMFVVTQGKDCLYRFINIDCPFILWLLPGEGEEVLYYKGSSLCLVIDNL